MIAVAFRLTNPFRTADFRNLWNRNWQLSRNWNFEIDVYWHARSLVSVEFDTRLGGDHDVVSLDVGVFGYCVTLQFYDRRHRLDDDFEQTV